MEPPQEQKPPVLEYHSDEDDYEPNATLLIRIVAGFCCVIFAGGSAYQWFFAVRPYDMAYLPALSVSLAGSLFFLLIACGVFGREKRKSK